MIDNASKDDYFRRTQQNLADNVKRVEFDIEQIHKENKKWLAALCCSISLEIRRPPMKTKKRRLNLDISATETIDDKFIQNGKRIKQFDKKDEIVHDKIDAKSDYTEEPVEVDMENSNKIENKPDLKETKKILKRKIKPQEMKVMELKRELKERGLKVSGLRKILVKRLTEALTNEINEKTKSEQETSEPSVQTSGNDISSVDDEIVNESTDSINSQPETIEDSYINVSPVKQAAIDMISEDVTENPEISSSTQPNVESSSPEIQSNDIQIFQTEKSDEGDETEFHSPEKEKSQVKAEKKDLSKKSVDSVIDLVTPEKETIAKLSVVAQPIDLKDDQPVAPLISKDMKKKAQSKQIAAVLSAFQKDRLPKIRNKEPNSITTYNSPEKVTSFVSSPPQSKKRKDSTSLDIAPPSQPKKAIKAIALFETTVSPFLPRNTSSGNTASLSNMDTEILTTQDQPRWSDIQDGATVLLKQKKPQSVVFESNVSPIRANVSPETPPGISSAHTTNSDSTGSSRKPLDSIKNTPDVTQPSPKQLKSNTSTKNDEAVSVIDSDILMSTAASLFASATSPIVKGFASFKSAFGLSKSKDDVVVNAKRDLYARATPPPKVPAPKVFQSRSYSTQKNMTSGKPASDNDEVPPVVGSNSKSSLHRTESSTSTHSSSGETEFEREEIERESMKIRMAAKVSAKKRIEQEMGKSKEKSPPLSAAEETKKSINAPSTHAEAPVAPVTTDAFSNDVSHKKSDAPAAVVRKPQNLVSGLHSFTVLSDKNSSQGSSQSSRGAGPIVVSSLKMAERNRLAEQKRELEKKKRKEALMKKYEDQRKKDEENRKRLATHGAKEQSEKALKDLRLKREREAAEKKLREAELAKKRQNRLQDMQAVDEKKKLIMKENEQAIKEKVEKMRQEQVQAAIESKINNDKHAVAQSTTNKNTSKTKKNSLEMIREKQTTNGELKNKIIPEISKENQPLQKEEMNYEISEGPESDESGYSDEEKKIPNWAQKDVLEKALAKQFGSHAIDPTPSIFPDFIDSCDLEAIFQPIDSKKKKRFNKRTSSGNWLADRPTMRDKVAYKRDMGFIN